MLRRSYSLAAWGAALGVLWLPVFSDQADAPPGRYELGEETVKDRQTGLTWQRKIVTETYSWNAALSHCQSLGAGWRLPAGKELLTLVDPTRDKPAIDITAFPNTPSERFWSASPFAGASGGGMFVDFSDGGLWHMDASTSARARCVR